MTSPRLLKGILTGILTGALGLGVLPDAEVRMVDVIVRGADTDEVAAAVVAHGGEVEFAIGLIDGVAADVPAELVDDLVADPRTSEVSPDGQVAALGRDKGRQDARMTGMDAARRLGLRGSGLDGSGIDVAVVDTGIDAHALPGTSVQRGINVSFEPSEDGNAGHGDGYGHGTAMAGIIAGNQKDLEGVAADARLIDVKVADARGVADVSQVLAGLDWVVSNRATDGRDIRVLSLSFGTDGTNSATTSPLVYAVEAAWRHGIVVVTAAGNHGAGLGRLSTPATSPNVIAVGAADLTEVRKHTSIDRTTVPAWSAVGSAERGVDVVAPGRSLLGGLAEGSTVVRDNPDAVDAGRLVGSGTSQATAFTAGVVAAMLEADPSLSPDRVKGLLLATAHPVGGDVRAVGAGVLDLAALLPRGRSADVPVAPVEHVWSDGTGSLDGDRGNFVLEDADGAQLTGQRTVVGDFDGSTWTRSTWTGSTWTGSTWTGSTWTGSTWTGSTWTGSTWTGSTWTGSTWTTVRWGD